MQNASFAAAMVAIENTRLHFFPRYCGSIATHSPNSDGFSSRGTCIPVDIASVAERRAAGTQPYLARACRGFASR
ncbi:MAG: hypothetical protein ACK4U0_18770 [Mesorhizobium sp.]